MRYLLAAMACASLLACATNEPKTEPRFVPASREMSPVEINGVCFAELTHARCLHDDRCGYVDSGKRFEDRLACLNYYNSVGYQSLHSCEERIDREQLKKCVSAIESANCDAPSADIGTFDECNYGALCPALLDQHAPVPGGRAAGR